MEIESRNNRRVRRLLGSIVLVISVVLCFGIGFVGTVTIALLLEGGPDLLFKVWSGNEHGHTSLVIASCLTGGIIGVWTGLWLWARLSVKTRFLTKDEITAITGLHWLAAVLERFDNESKRKS